MKASGATEPERVTIVTPLGVPAGLPELVSALVMRSRAALR